MKRNFLLLITGLLLSLSANAQWNTDTNENLLVTPVGQANYGCTVETNKNGISYVFMELPITTITENDTISRIVMKLQILDKNGKKLFPDEGVVISDEPTDGFTVVGKRILIDDNGDAVFSVCDRRTGSWSYTLYKYNEKGEKLWGDVQMNEGKPLLFAAGIDMCQTTDGGYVVTYLCNEKSGKISDSFIQFEKVSRDGKTVWAPKKIGGGENDEECSNASLVASESNQAILVYSKGANKNLMARMLDFEGENAWGEDVVVYNGGSFGTIPLHTMMKVYEGPNNGAIVSWCDGRNNINYQNCIAYITSEGTHAFNTGTAGTNVSNDDNDSRRAPKLFYDDKQKAIFCFFHQFNQTNQGWNGLFLQKISFEGELLWGPNGKAVIEIQNENGYGYESIRDIDDDRFAIFYQERLGSGGYGKVSSFITIYDKKNGEPLSEPYNFSTSDYMKSSLKSSELIDGKYFLCNWSEDRRDINNEEDKTPEGEYIQYVSLDAVVSGIEEVNTDSNTGKPVETEIFSVDGKKLNSLIKGVNIVRTTYANGNVVINKITK